MNLHSLLPEGADKDEAELFEVEDDVANAPSAAIWDELWPDWGESLDRSPERAYTDIRSELRAARMFSLLAVNADRCRGLADYFTYLAETHAAELQDRIELRATVGD